MLAHDLTVIAPELMLAVFALAALMWGAFQTAREEHLVLDS